MEEFVEPSKQRAYLNYKEVCQFNNEHDFDEWIKSSDWTR